MKHRKAISLGGILVLLLISSAWWWLVGYDNYHAVVAGELYRSAQVAASELRAYIERDKLATVVNLREDTNGAWWAEEKAVCEEAGTIHVDVPWSGDRGPTMEEMEKLASILRDCRKPLLIHCKYGADRTSLAVALYLHEKGSTEPEPWSAFSPAYGHLPMLFRKVKCFDESFRAYEESNERN